MKRTVLCAVKQSLLDRELRSLALTDDLTCLYNRRAFLALAGQQLKVARRNAQGLLLFSPMLIISRKLTIPSGIGKVTSP